MNKTQHPSNNKVLGAPQGWDQSQGTCDALPVTRIDTTQGPAVCSYWKPTREEIRMLAAGGLVELLIMGETMPPVALGVKED